GAYGRGVSSPSRSGIGGTEVHADIQCRAEGVREEPWKICEGAGSAQRGAGNHNDAGPHSKEISEPGNSPGPCPDCGCCGRATRSRWQRNRHDDYGSNRSGWSHCAVIADAIATPVPVCPLPPSASAQPSAPVPRIAPMLLIPACSSRFSSAPPSLVIK